MVSFLPHTQCVFVLDGFDISDIFLDYILHVYELSIILLNVTLALRFPKNLSIAFLPKDSFGHFNCKKYLE